MADAEEPQDVAPKKSKKPLIIGLIAAVLLGAGGFYATYSGLILGNGNDGAQQATAVEPLPDITFVPIEPLVISLGPAAKERYLRFTSQLEVNGAMAADVTLLIPRIVDVMNGYLRAVDPVSFDAPSTMLLIRAQLLRRIQMVTGDGRVRDLLITEFVLN